LGDKIRALRKQKKLSLEQLAELTDSSKSYIWELEKKDDPKPSAYKIGKIAAVLDVTTEFLLIESTATPDEAVLDEAFFRKYKTMSEPDKKKLRKILEAWDDEDDDEDDEYRVGFHVEAINYRVVPTVGTVFDPALDNQD
jgi:transcriptional regulator with XRE-family HTH domain